VPKRDSLSHSLRRKGPMSVYEGLMEAPIPASFHTGGYSARLLEWLLRWGGLVDSDVARSIITCSKTMKCTKAMHGSLSTLAQAGIACRPPSLI
jgi:hypothetical protein